MNNNINYGEGGSASCVLVPPFNCKGKKYDENYISKIASISNSGIKITIQRELIISQILKSKSKYKKVIDKYFLLIDDYCKLIKNEENINILNKRGCNIDKNQEYVILYSKNGACKPLKKGDIVSLKLPESYKIQPIIPYTYLGKQGSNYILEDQSNSIFIYGDISRFCGDLSNINILYRLFSEPKKRKKNIKHLLKALEFLLKNHIIHCDLKLKNIVCNEKEELKIIDFGGSFSLKDNKNFNFKTMCNTISSNDENTINYRTQYNTNFVNEILDLISIHTEYYTPPEILILKLLLLEKNENEIIDHIIEAYNIKDNLVIQSYIEKIVRYVTVNKKIMLYDLQCDNNIKKFIYKFDIYSMGINFRELFKILYAQFNVVIEDSLKELIEKMTDLNFKSRLNINQIIKHKYFR